MLCFACAVARLSWSRAIAYFVIFFTSISVTTYFLPPWLNEVTNGTTAYLPALAGFVFFGLVSLVRGSRAGWYAIACAFILCLAFSFRAVDQVACDSDCPSERISCGTRSSR